MRAAVLRRFGAPLELEERPAPRPRGDEVLVRVRATGVCHSDLHLVDGRFPDVPLPRILGHEIAGEVEGLGSVLVYASWGCGTCSWCLRGEENLCPQATEPGWRRDGGYAEYVVVPSPRYLLSLHGIDPVRAAPLADAGVTSYRAVRRAIPWLVDPSTAVVIGSGGLGQFAIQYLKLFTNARVLVLETSGRRRQLARRLGADEAVATEEVTGRREWEFAHAVLDFVGTDQTLELCARLVRRGGIVVQVGDEGGRVFFGLGLLPHEAHLTTSIWGSARDLRTVLDLARNGLLRWEVEPFALEDVNRALQRLRQGLVAGRLVITP
jgi:alcohol dehydrogenase, propanol-preferring